MKKVFHFDKEGKLRAYSDKKIETELNQVELPITKSDFDKIKSNLYDGFIKEGKLVLKPSQRLEHQQKIDKQKQIINKIKSGKHTNKELAALLEEII